MLHRDLSSPNIFIHDNGDLVVGDLGVSKKTGATTFTLQNEKDTPTDSYTPKTTIGTPQYMSPELLNGQSYGPPADAWAVGVLLFELLALERPFEGKNLLNTVLIVTKGTPTPSALAALQHSGYPEGFFELASNRGLLRPNPEERQRIDELAERFPLPSDDAWRSVLSSPERIRPRSVLQARGIHLHRLPEGASPHAARVESDDNIDTFSTDSTSFGGKSAGSSVGETMTTHVGITVPLECPLLPLSLQPRDELIQELKVRLLDPATVQLRPLGLEGATVIVGMGGTGKSTVAASFMRDVAAAADYDRVCWLPVGQSPDLRRLLLLLRTQLLGKNSAVFDTESPTDLPTLSQHVVEAALGKLVFCVLDDVWETKHALALGKPLGLSTLLITSRTHDLFVGLRELPCGTLSLQQAVEMLLRCGGVQDIPEGGARAAQEIAKLCGMLPLALSLAGAMIQEYADIWPTVLPARLRRRDKAALRKQVLEGEADDDGDSDEETGLTMETRVITSSLSLLRSKKHHSAVVLFYMCAVFPEDSIVPCAIFDSLESVFAESVQADRAARKRLLTPGKGSDKADGKEEDGSTLRVRPRRSLQTLLKMSLLQGSIRDGISMHDLLRAHASEHLSDGSKMQLQRDLVSALCAMLEEPDVVADVKAYLEAHLQHHVMEALHPSSKSQLELDSPVLKIALGHRLEWLKLAVGRGIGAATLHTVADRAMEQEQFLLAGQIWMLLSGVDVENEGECRHRAWRLLQQVTPVTELSVNLEAVVLRGLILKKGGLQINSPEHIEANYRLDELLDTSPGKSCELLKSVRNTTMGAFLFAQLHALSSEHRCDSLLDVYKRILPTAGVSHTASKLGASQPACRAIAALNQFTLNNATLHTLPDFLWDAGFGEAGSGLRSLVDWYDHTAHHAAFKSSSGRDVVGSGLGVAALLLRWGVEADWKRTIVHWEGIQEDVRRGNKSLKTFRIDVLDVRATRAIAIAAGCHDEARALFYCLPEGDVFSATMRLAAAAGEVDRAEARAEQQSASAALAAHVQSVQDYMEHWGMKCKWSEKSFELMALAVGTLLLPDNMSVPTTALAEWLPHPTRLLELAAAESAWDVYMTGAQHPALACALVYARLGQWDEARTVAEGLLHMIVQPITRFEVQRLISRCDSAVGSRESAATRARLAAGEAATAGYQFLEALAAREASLLE